MDNQINFPVKKVFLFLLFLEIFHVAFTQPLTEELNSKLQSTDQKKLQKAISLYSESKTIEEEAKQILNPESTQDQEKSTKLYHKKMEESVEKYRDANSLRYKIYMDNIKKFWKQFKGEKQKLDFAKTVENSADDLYKKAIEFRFSADKSRKFEEQVSFINQAKSLEAKSLEMLQKVLYAYLSWPVEYDREWLSSNDLNLPKIHKSELKEPKSVSDSKTTLKDTIKTSKNEKKESKEIPVNTVKKDTVTTKLVESKPKTETKEPVKVPVKEEKAETKAKTPDAQPKTETKEPIKAPVTEVKTETKVTTKPVESKPKTETKEPVKVPVESKSKVVKGEDDVAGGDSSLYGIMHVNEDQVDQFNDFLTKTYPSSFENYIIHFEKLDYSDINSLRNAWYKYLFGRVPGDTTQLLANAEEANIDSSKISKESNANNSKQNQKNLSSNQKKQAKENKRQLAEKIEKENKQAVEKNGKENKKQTAGTIEKEITSGQKDLNISKEGTVRSSGLNISRYSGKSKESSKGLFTYKVQIAACRVSLDEQTLLDIYSGAEKITESFEDNWYKYTISESSTFRSARKVRDQLQIPGAFVIAYLHGKRINATPANKQMSGAHITPDMNPDLILFRVQIAASRRPLSGEFLKYIYNSGLPIDSIIEDGWHKYSLNVGGNYKKARILARQSAVPGAFVIAYYETIKLDLYEAIKYVKTGIKPIK
jgi:hypothetical protein